MSVFKSHHPVAAVLIACALAVASPFAAGPAFAQTPKETRTSYQAYLAADCLEGSNFCKFVSEPVPDDARLDIERVACQGWHTSDVAPTFVVMGELRTSDNTFVGRIDFLEARYTRATWGSVWAISEQTRMFIPAAHRLRITLNSGSTVVGSYGCTISGYLVTR